MARIPRAGRERVQYWVYFDRQFKSKFIAPVVLLNEKLPKEGSVAQKIVPLALRIRCTNCRRESERRGHCEHERAIVKEAEMLFNDTPHDVQPEFPLQLDLRGVDESFLEELLQDSIEDDTKITDDDLYLSKLPRQFIRCISDDLSIEMVLEKSIGKTDDELWAGQWVKVCDVGESCRKCGKILIYDPEKGECDEGIERVVQFHGLKTGTMRITVIDLICRSCNHVNLLMVAVLLCLVFGVTLCFHVNCSICGCTKCVVSAHHLEKRTKFFIFIH